MNTYASHCSTARQTGRNRSQALRRVGISMALTLALALAACGGGGSDGASDSATAAPASASAALADSGMSTVAAVASSTAASTHLSTDTTCGNTQLPAQLIAGINALRASAQSCGSKGNFSAAAPLTWNALLFDAAAGHSTDMASRGFFSHISPEGQTMQDRANAAGYDWSVLAENIAAGQSSVASVLSSWMASPGHCANIMGAAYREVALSCVRSEAGTRYWTLSLGRP